MSKLSLKHFLFNIKKIALNLFNHHLLKALKNLIFTQTKNLDMQKFT